MSGSLPQTQTIIRVENLTHIYNPGTSLEKKALSDVSLEIRSGECVGIVGETGSGKTTLVQHLVGLLRPSSGRLWVEGKPQEEILWPELRRRVGLIFQYPEHQLFEETVFADISFILRQSKFFSSGEIERRVRDACLSVGLDYETVGKRSPFELSGGEMRRVALAGVLAQQPRLLILDEPTVGLDGPGRREILEEVARLNRSGKTVVIVSHGIEDLLDLVDRLIVMEKGRVITSGSPEDVFRFLLRAEKLTFLIPPVFRLCQDLRASGWDLPEKILHVEEALPALDRVLRSRCAPGPRPQSDPSPSGNALRALKCPAQG